MNQGALLPTTAGTPSPGRHPVRGFTLIELMITVAIIAIIAAIAIPSYQQYITKTRRGAAAACSLEAAQYMERFYTTHMSYRTAADAAPALPAGECVQETSDHYTITVATASDSEYTISAAPQGVQADRDTECGTLTVTQTGAKDASGSGPRCW